MHQHNMDTVLDALRDFELTVALLYDTYSSIFQSDSSTWKSFAVEEELHAKWLTRLKLHLNNREISPEKAAATVQSISKAVAFLQEQILWARKNQMNIREAVLIAQKIANFVLEGLFMETIDFDDPRADVIQQMFIMETIDHRDKLSFWLETIENKAQLMAA